MASAVTPSETITLGEIGKIQELLGAALRKSGLKNEPTQQVLKSQGAQMTAELVAVVRKYVEALSNIITRPVSVNRARTPQEVLKATDRKQYVTASVVATMPKGEGDKVEIHFFNPHSPLY